MADFGFVERREPDGDGTGRDVAFDMVRGGFEDAS